MISDYYASGLSGADSCAATVVARTQLPPRFKEGTAIVHAFDVHERAVCTGAANPLSATAVFCRPKTQPGECAV